MLTTKDYEAQRRREAKQKRCERDHTVYQFPMERGQQSDGPEDRKEMALREPESRARLASVLELHEADTQKVGQSQRPLTARVLRVLPEATVPLTFPPRRSHSAHPNIWQLCGDGADRKPPKSNLIKLFPPPHRSLCINHPQFLFGPSLLLLDIAT